MAEDELGFRSIVSSWYESLKKPEENQTQLLASLLKEYSRTRYGKEYGAERVGNVNDFRRSFPILNYGRLRPYLNEVISGGYSSILPEPLVCWVMTRGSTGAAKVLPATKTHLEQVFTCGARALVNYVTRKQDMEILTGRVLNLNLPSNVHRLDADGRDMSYGYSSGTYARLNPAFNMFGLTPKQEEIDALGPGIKKTDWERRFEMVYQKASGENVTSAIGVTPVIQSFGRYVERKHGKKPRQLWKMHALFCTSVANIPFKYAPGLKRLFGDIPVVEMYSATEGVFAQQLDDLPYISPNYDKYLFEVDTGKGTKMLHELKRGEWGRLIVSSCMFPRYDIGDMVEAAGENYFRVFGRNKALTVLEHRIYRLLFGWML